MSYFAAIIALALAFLVGCESLSQARFGVAFAQADTELQVSYGNGKAVVQAEQGDQRVRGYYQR